MVLGGSLLNQGFQRIEIVCIACHRKIPHCRIMALIQRLVHFPKAHHLPEPNRLVLHNGLV